MISVENLTFGFGEKPLFKDVSVKFLPGGCYGVIGANGAGKSTFLKILSGELEYNKGSINMAKGQRMAVLKQDHFAYDDFSAIETVIMGHKELYDVMREKDTIYAKENMSDEDGLRVADLEDRFAQMGGWEAESEAHTLLDGLGVDSRDHEKIMKDMDDGRKVRILLAQALFGNPDLLILDEPTNGLDMESINWLEEFLIKFDNIVIVVSHDRHFLNQVCTHIADIDFGRIQLFTGNYDFWYHTNQILMKQTKDHAKKRDERVKELKEFIMRFSSNASKSRQATSRKKILDKIMVDDIQPSTRRFPYVNFKANRPCGDMILRVEGLCKSNADGKIIENLNFIVNKGDKIAFVGSMHTAKSTLFEILAKEMAPDMGTFEWGQTISMSYFPKENTEFFDNDMNMTQWLQQYSDNVEETYVRGFLGRMLFSGDESMKSVKVLSGGEKVRCMLSRMMLASGNVLVLDEPTNHLDLESITALNDALVEFPEVILFNCHDHEFVSSVANRIIELAPGGIIDRQMNFEDYINDEKVKALREELWQGQNVKEFL
ncbi:MAG: ABC-F family ATP-binding cassette domain-containing protein [Spirochaetia bacterium]